MNSTCDDCPSPCVCPVQLRSLRSLATGMSRAAKHVCALLPAFGSLPVRGAKAQAREQRQSVVSSASVCVAVAVHSPPAGRIGHALPVRRPRRVREGQREPRTPTANRRETGWP